MNYDVMTLDGNRLLKQAGGDSSTTVFCDDDIVLSTDEHGDCALFHQLIDLLSTRQRSVSNDHAAIKHSLVYIDFSDAFPLTDKAIFDRLFLDGVVLAFSGGWARPRRFVPFISSQSQSKKHIFAFIREDLFAAMRARLDLDLPLEAGAQKKLQTLAKMYAYRALYTSAATPLFHARDEGAEYFFNEDNIIILDDVHRSSQKTVSVFTVDNATENEAGEVIMTPAHKETKIDINCFDGVGIISPAQRKIFNDHLPNKMRGSSFQVRMPFFKGVLHTVNFHQFLRDNGVTAEQAFVKDVFGKERDLFKANVIVTTSIFKLHGMLDEEAASDKAFMRSYFEKLREYNHGLYVIKTEASFRDSTHIRLSSQLMSTLCLSSDELDELVQSHLDVADAFCEDNLQDEEARKQLCAISAQSDWMQLLLKEPRFINDGHIRSMLDSYRVARYNDVALGRLRVRGENRFLSGDLFYMLIQLLKMVAERQPQLQAHCDELSHRCIRSGAVYIPQAAVDIDKVALFRSPHLSRNEEVYTKRAKGGYYHYYEKYLNHLKGVVFVGHRSCIPAALGGADFDGDHVGIVYDPLIIEAYRRGGYVEIWNEPSNARLVNIPVLHGGCAVEPYAYVSPQVVYNTFTNRIGIISNAAMCIAAVEYHGAAEKPAYPTALCTVLTGTEIDATKKGVRPHIDDVVNYSGQGDDRQARIVSDVKRYIDAKKVIKTNRNRIPTVKADGDTLIASTAALENVSLCANRDGTAVPQLLYRWAQAFKDFAPSKHSRVSQKTLREIFDGQNINAEQALIILDSFDNVRKLYDTLSSKRRIIKAITEKNRAKACVRLKMQYDDVFTPTDTERSLWDQYQALQKAAGALLGRYTIEEFEQLLECLFSETADKFDAAAFWPYGGAAPSMPLYESIMQLPHAELLRNFDVEGYRLLHYLLEDVINAASITQDKGFTREDEFSQRYFAFYQQQESQMPTEKLFNNQLAALAREDLFAALNTRDISELIRCIYPLVSNDRRTAFWRVFTIDEVLTALRGDENAQ